MWVMLTALFSMVVGILLTGFAGGLPLLVAGAVVLGAGAGTAMVTGAQGVALVLDHQKLAKASACMDWSQWRPLPSVLQSVSNCR